MWSENSILSDLLVFEKGWEHQVRSLLLSRSGESALSWWSVQGWIFTENRGVLESFYDYKRIQSWFVSSSGMIFVIIL